MARPQNFLKVKVKEKACNVVVEMGLTWSVDSEFS